MLKNNKKIILSIFLAVFFSMTALANLSSQEELAFKIWHNECAAKPSGLLAWNKGEDFASLGIGHFIWYPDNIHNSKRDGFTGFLTYIKKEGIELPQWLSSQDVPMCPWRSAAELEWAKNHDKKAQELKDFLLHTVSFQVKYIIYRFQMALPRLLKTASPEEQEVIYHELYQLMQSPAGIYALVDYMNFKGDGAKGGLLQVLREMQHAPAILPPNKAYAWAARRVLIKRFLNAPLGRHEERWLRGWLKRVDTYA